MNHKSFLYFASFIFLIGCATYKPQQVDDKYVKSIPQKEIAHTFYLIGDGGNSPINDQAQAITQLKKALNDATEKSTVLFLGDNIYPSGMPKKGDSQRAFAEHQLNVQTSAVKDFKGKTYFIPGNHDWYSGGLKGLKRQENYIEKKLGKGSFLPQNGCPITKVNISEDIVMLVVDTEWYIANWDKHPTINDDCEIKTRVQFFNELKGQIKKARGKTTLLAMHHPMYTNGPHGGQYSLAQQLFPLGNSFPLPVLGSFLNLVRKTGGVSPTDLQNKKYLDLKKRMVTLAQENTKVILVSGHEHSLQYLVQDNLPQIISGAGSKTTATRNVGGGQFSYGAAGYTKLIVYKDGSSFVQFFDVKDNSVVFQTEVLTPNQQKTLVTYPYSFPKEKAASVYTQEEVTKGSLYKTIWGNRYRKYYGTKVNAPTVSLDTLFGGLTPVRKGGGNQSKSLRLKDSQGREYVMRALRKNAVQYLQAVAFKTQFIDGQFNNTYTESLLMDVFAGSHPYAPFTIGTLADAINIYHTNPVLYYIPKQNTLGHFNEEFGDELYMIEERAASGHGDNKSFGNSNKLISTNDMLKKIRKNQNHEVDENMYIRARLFDMLIGDWDRHEDQWRWATFKENGKTIYRPVPRDRDQAFSIMGDGPLLGIATSIVPALRLMKSYEEELKSPKWFNLEPYPLDMAIITKSTKVNWDAQVQQIVTNISDDIINTAFTYFPKEVQDKTIDDIKRKLKGRRENLQKISNNYYHHINKFSLIIGTDKDDWFDVERLPNGTTKVIGYRIQKGEKGDIFHEKTYNKGVTKEIWIYGLDDKDIFHVFGKGNNPIMVRLIGGQNKDTYNIKNGKKIKFYDYKSKESTVVTNKGAKKFTDDYETNVYDYKKLKNNANQLIPSIGSNPDDGLKIGLANTYTRYGFERNPFTSQHIISGAYYFATNGFELNYSGEFANVFQNWNLTLGVDFTSPNYAINFFGFGNNSQNLNAVNDDVYDRDYNRVKIRTFKTSAAIKWSGDLGATFSIGANYERNEVEKTAGRFISTTNQLNNSAFSDQQFIGAEAHYNYAHNDNEAFPTLGMQADLQMGYKANTNNTNSFGYIIPSLGFDYKLVASGQLVLATKAKGHFTLGNGYEFYQAASIGGNDGLRGFRNQRFTSKNAFYHSSDIRLNLRRIKTGLLPLNIGVYGGFDYGTVWGHSVTTLNPNLSNRDWNTSIGGGLFFNAANMLTGNLSAFDSDDGLRISFAVGFAF